MPEEKEACEGKNSKDNRLFRIQKSSFYVGSENRLKRINAHDDSKKEELSSAE
jgi:hypothetical protein